MAAIMVARVNMQVGSQIVRLTFLDVGPDQKTETTISDLAISREGMEEMVKLWEQLANGKAQPRAVN